MDLGRKQNNIDSLPKLDDVRYENIFRVYSEDSYYFYNIMTTINFYNLDSEEYYFFYKVNRSLPWPIISYENYKTIHLWWLICITNNIDNPTSFPTAGTVLKIIKPQYVAEVLDKISEKTNV